jgi:four helix bundle protein
MAGTIRVLEDLVVAFEKARYLARMVSGICATGQLARDPVIRNQMRRAPLSVVANVAEGFERDGNREFLNFLSIAKGSAGEIRAHAYMAFDARIISQAECRALVAASNDFCAVAGGLMRYLRSTPMAGAKWKDEGSRPGRVGEASMPYVVLEDRSEDTWLEIPSDQFGVSRADMQERATRNAKPETRNWTRG